MRVSVVLAFSLLMSSAAVAQTGPIHFHNANKEAGLPMPGSTQPEMKYIVQQMAGGVALFDCDNDGKLDIAVVTPSTIPGYRAGGDLMVTLYHQDPGFKFTDITKSAGLTRKGWGMGLAVADYDNDGLPDLYVTGYGGNALYHNLGNCKFEDVTDRAGVAGGGFSTGAAWGDYDRDGNVDLFVSRYIHTDVATLGEIKTSYKGLVVEAPWGMSGESDFLFHNRGNGTFEEVSRKAGVSDPEGRLGLGVVWGDYDNDGWPDIFVANDTEPSYLYRNKHDGTFEDQALLSGAAVSAEGKAMGSMGVDFGDFDRDGRLDITVATFAYQPDNLFHNAGDEFNDITWAAKLGQPTFRWVKWGTGFVDFDNDGLQDILVASGHIYTAIDQLPGEPAFREPMILFRNTGQLKFDDVSDTSGVNDEPLQSRRGIAFGDLNNDGNIDAVVFNVNGPPSILINDTRNSNHRVMFRLVGTTSNRAAIGARVTITAGGVTQLREVKGGNSYISQSDLRLHFGLGKENRIAKIEIRWPNGKTEELKDLAADAIYTVVEGSGIKETLQLPPVIEPTVTKSK
ncbi:MAG TPA: CRTAC1 family protein [Terriglobales bacterium]